MSSATETTPDDSPESSAAEAKKTKGAKRAERHLYPREWWEIVSMARNGVPIGKIAKAFKVQRSTIYRGLRKRNVTLGPYMPNANETRAQEERNELVERVRDTKNRDFTYTDFLQRQIISIVTEAQKAHVPISTKIDDIKALKIAIDGIKNGTANKWLILGLDKENADADKTLPELPVRELTPAEVIAIRDKQALEDMDDDALDRLDEEPDLEEVVIEGEEDAASAS